MRKGVTANLLYLAESNYPTPAANDARKPISVSAWLQYALDNYATVQEAVTALRAEPLYVVAVATPDGRAGSVHLALSDPTGDSAIFEYVGGKLVIHHGREYQVMTNSPIYDQQLALAAYWQQIGGTVMLPGTNQAADRFTRASFYINAIPKTSKATEAVASVFSVISQLLRTASVYPHPASPIFPPRSGAPSRITRISVTTSSPPAAPAFSGWTSPA